MTYTEVLEDKIKELEDKCATHSSLENQYLTCIAHLRDSTHHIKAITSRLDSIHTSIVKDAIYSIEDGVSTLEGELVEEIKR